VPAPLTSSSPSRTPTARLTSLEPLRSCRARSGCSAVPQRRAAPRPPRALPLSHQASDPADPVRAMGGRRRNSTSIGLLWPSWSGPPRPHDRILAVDHKSAPLRGVRSSGLGRRRLGCQRRLAGAWPRPSVEMRLARR
jgi:hypothetical protein